MNDIQEFWYHVASQDEIPIYGDIDKSIDLNLFNEFLLKIKKGNFVNLTKDFLIKKPDLLDKLRTFAGVSDKRLYLDLSYLFAKKIFKNEKNIFDKTMYELDKHPVKYFKNLLNNNKEISNFSSKIIVDYLVSKNIEEIILPLSKLNAHELKSIYKNLILPKEIQQKEAKLRGHGAEKALAKVLNALGCNFIPAKRHEDPMSEQDPNVNKKNFHLQDKKMQETWSFDLILKDNDFFYGFVQSLIHTSDPGQYGVNKSNETVEIKSDIRKYNKLNKKKIHLIGLVDGVGFSENKKDTINKMIEEFDVFLQIKTLYKIGLFLHKLKIIKLKGIVFSEEYEQKDSDEMFKKYGSSDIKIFTKKESANQNMVQAGFANLIL
ncbi:hypothetical protein N9A46_02485 [Candidatus Pelagibacter ubique]|nr:hypothetical protein [Candidatus Pelagibacter ubique]